MVKCGLKQYITALNRILPLKPYGKCGFKQLNTTWFLMVKCGLKLYIPHGF